MDEAGTERAGILDSLPDAVLLVRTDGTIAYANSTAESLFGYSVEELLRLDLEMLIPDRLRAAHASHRADYFTEPDSRPMGLGLDLYALRKDGSEFPVDISLSYAGEMEDHAAVAAIRDITARRKVEEELHEARETLEKAYAEISQLKDRLQAEAAYLREEIETGHLLREIVGSSTGLKGVFQLVDQVAPNNVTVLLLGETGTGKELIARAIHDSSPRREHPLIKVNCAALPDTLIESELFGHEMGSFTGAAGQRKGRFELADGGTIFLDEIGDLLPGLQAKLLRVLQSGEFERLGSEKTLTADVRVISATNRNLEAAVADGSFRPDLYYRLKVFPIEVPPLRDRREDVPLLVWHFITTRQATLGRRVETIPRRMMERLVAYDWPGNVRELEHVVERALILSPGSTLMVEELVSVPGAAAPLHAGSSQQMVDAERAHVLRVLRDCAWKVKGSGNAAERLGLNPSTLRSRMKKLGIERPTRG